MMSTVRAVPPKLHQMGAQRVSSEGEGVGAGQGQEPCKQPAAPVRINPQAPPHLSCRTRVSLESLQRVGVPEIASVDKWGIK